ncbi:hypothetical protein Halha_1094 [Halobacteroides halobius DSM 5150]|uniref:Uncharacterized protein n=1 Tax=Halobacteroides halobius (strain ATCC 35273 / DSM 5150 / MD-1) TaxID=748449 RepID=L0KAB5_HALHC|nr:hypothetical protein Halha_1094 [Halobacteroides halobius DSM 5150]
MELRRAIKLCKEDLKGLLNQLDLLNEKLDLKDDDYLEELSVKIEKKVKERLGNENIIMALHNILGDIRENRSFTLGEAIDEIVENKEEILRKAED